MKLELDYERPKFTISSIVMTFEPLANSSGKGFKRSKMGRSSKDPLQNSRKSELERRSEIAHRFEMKEPETKGPSSRLNPLPEGPPVEKWSTNHPS